MVHFTMLDQVKKKLHDEMTVALTDLKFSEVVNCQRSIEKLRKDSCKRIVKRSYLIF